MAEQGREQASPGGSLRDKVNWLFNEMWPPSLDPPQTNVEAAEMISAATGEDISSTTVWKLRTGRADNPQLKTLRQLAKFFGVPIGYFGDGEEAESLADQLALLAILRDTGVSRASLRALVNLPEEGRQMVADILASAARMEERRRERQQAPDQREG